MEKIKIFNAIENCGFTVEGFVRYLWQEHYLKPEFLQNLLKEDVALLGLTPFKAESGKIKVGMFYYAVDKTFSKELILDKQVSGVVAWVTRDGCHGLVVLLHERMLPWSSDDLFVGLPQGLNGKENTRLILEKACLENKKVEAAEYCAKYAFYGIKAGEAFLPSQKELQRVFDNALSINMSLAKIENAELLRSVEYWSSCENGERSALALSFLDETICHYSRYIGSLGVRPVVAF